MENVFLSQFARVLIVCHAFVGMALLGSATHLAWAAWSLWRGRPTPPRFVARHAVICAALYSAAIALGLLLYPHFRVHVRGLFLDREAPWASNLFDMKENLALLGWAPSLAMAAMRASVAPKAAVLPFFAVCAGACWGLVSFAAVSGVIVTSVRGV